MKNAFYFNLKLFSFLRYLNFSLDFFCYLGIWLDKKAKVNFKMFDVINWETNNCSTHIVQYIKK